MARPLPGLRGFYRSRIGAPVSVRPTHGPTQDAPVSACLLAHALDLDPDLEEVDLGQLPRRVDERHGDLALGVAKRCNEPAYRPPADVVTVVAEQLPETRRGEPLLARRERATRRPDCRRRLGHELLRRCGARWAGRSGHRNNFGPDIPPDGVARETQLPRDIADRDALGQHLVTNDGDELHGNHPWAKTPRPVTVQPTVRGGSISRGHERRARRGVGQFLVATEGQFRLEERGRPRSSRPGRLHRRSY